MQTVPGCECENEAKVLYQMYKKLGTLRKGTWQTQTCCSEDPATLTVTENSVTLTYADGSVSTYTDPVVHIT